MARKPLSLHSARTLWTVSLALVVVFFCVAEYFRGASSHQFGGPQWFVAALGVWSAWGGHSLRRKLMINAARATNKGNEDVGCRKWSAAQAVGIASAVGVVLWGVVADLTLQSPMWLGALLYAAGALLLILYRPQAPSIPTSS
jgi:hypothetical protein